MATFTFAGWMGAGPSWTDLLAADRYVFTDSLTAHNTTVLAAAYQDGSHVADGDPGTHDADCLTNHINNIKWLTSTTFSKNGGGSTAINDTNLPVNDATMRITFADAASVQLQTIRFYTWNGTTRTVEAVGVDCQAFVEGEVDTAWTIVNDDTTAGALTVGNIGGDNAGERYDIADRTTPATSHAFHVSLSVAPEAAGAKAAFDVGMSLEFF